MLLLWTSLWTTRPAEPLLRPAACTVPVHPLWTGESFGCCLRCGPVRPTSGRPADSASSPRRTTGRSSGWRCPPSAPWWPSRCSCSPTRPSSGTSAPRSWPGSAWPAPCWRPRSRSASSSPTARPPPVARRVGAGDLRAAIAQGVDGIWLALGLGALLAAALAAAAGPLVDAFGTSAAATPYALTYLHVSALGLPAMLVVLAATGVLRGLQDTRHPAGGRRRRRRRERRAEPRPRVRRRPRHRRLRARHGARPVRHGGGVPRRRGPRRPPRGRAAAAGPARHPGRGSRRRPARRPDARRCERRCCSRPTSPPRPAPWRSPRTRWPSRSGCSCR